MEGVDHVRSAVVAVRLFSGLRGPRHSSKQLNRGLREWSPMGALPHTADWWVINAHASAMNSRQPIVCVPVSVACRVLIRVRFAKSAVRLFLGLRGPRHSSKQLNRGLREWSPMGALSHTGIGGLSTRTLLQ